jgi:hypothetical protein
MKDKKFVDHIFTALPFIIAFILEYNLSNLLRLNREKILSVGTAISLVIFVAIYAMATIVISVLRDKKPSNKNVGYNSTVSRNKPNKSTVNKNGSYKNAYNKNTKKKRK